MKKTANKSRTAKALALIRGDNDKTVTKVPEAPEKESQEGNLKRMERVEEEALRETICTKIGDLRDELLQWGTQGVGIINRCREIGMLIKKALESLPGKQMTIDFWQKQGHLYRDQYGNPISREMLIWFVRVSENEKEPIDDIPTALSYRKQMMMLLGFELQGEAPGRDATEETNYFTQLTNQLPRFAKYLDLAVKSLEGNNKFGRLELWPAQRAKLTLQRVEPIFKTISDMHERLQKAAGIGQVS